MQANAHSVQAELNQALQRLLRHPVETIGSGRTDTGVHAQQQFVHLDTHFPLSDDAHLYTLNALLPPDIVIKKIIPVPEQAHARFDAIARSYEYRISRTKDPFREGLCYFYRRQPDVGAMNQAAGLLLKYTDFESFSRVHTEVNHFNCTITEAYWKEEADLLIFHISANRFLRGMVRAIVGTVLAVGEGKLTVARFEEIIRHKDRKKAGHAVPPQGLFLTRVQYPFI